MGDEIIEVLEGSADVGGGRVLNPRIFPRILIFRVTADSFDFALDGLGVAVHKALVGEG